MFSLRDFRKRNLREITSYQRGVTFGSIAFNLPRFERIIVICITLIAFIATMTNRVWVVFDYSPDVAGIEQTFVHAVQQKVSTGKIYHDPEGLPYVFFQYSPLYFDLIALFIRSADDIREIYLAGRSVSLLSNLAVSGLLFLLGLCVFRMPLYWSVALGFLSFTIFSSHNYAVRPDSLKTFFSTLSLFAVFYYLKRPSTLLLLLTAVISGLTFFVKQDGLISPLLIIIVLFIHGQLKSLMKFSFLSMSTFAVVLIYYLLFYGTDLIANVFRGLDQGFNFRWFELVIRYYWMDVCLLFSVVSIPIFAFGKWLIDKHVAALILCAVIALVVNVFALSKWGSAFVYLLDGLLLALAASFVAIDRIRLNTALVSLLRICFVVVIVSIVAILSVSKTTSRYTYSESRDAEEKARWALRNDVARMISDKFESSDEKILCFDKSLGIILWRNTVFNTFEAEFPNFLSCDFDFPFGPKKIFDYQGMWRQIESGQIKWIVSRGCNQIEQMFPPKDLNFRVVASAQGYHLYERYDLTVE